MSLTGSALRNLASPITGTHRDIHFSMSNGVQPVWCQSLQ